MGRASGVTKEFEIGDITRSGLDFLGDPYSEALEIVKRLEKTPIELEEIFENISIRGTLLQKNYPLLQERATKALLREPFWRKQFEEWGGFGEDGLARYVYEVVGVGNAHSPFVVRGIRSHYRAEVFANETLCGIKVDENSHPSAYRGDRGSMCSECQRVLAELPKNHRLHAGLQLERARGQKWLSDNLPNELEKIKSQLRESASSLLQDPSVENSSQVSDPIHEQAIRLIGRNAISSLSRRTEISRRWFLFTPAAPAGSNGNAHETNSLISLGNMVRDHYPINPNENLPQEIDIDSLVEDIHQAICEGFPAASPVKNPKYCQFLFAGHFAARYYPEACKAYLRLDISKRLHDKRLAVIWRDKYGISA